MVRYGKLSLVIVSIMAFAVAIAKTSCIYFGEQCYSVQMAPSIIVDSAREGTLVAPVGAIVASTIFIVIGLLPLQLWIRKPELVSDSILIIGMIWLLCGLMLFFGGRVNQVK